jgi:hypothetical protein
MKNCLLLLHLGLGDLILCNGLIREVKKRYEQVYIPVKKHNVINFTDLFKDEKNINFLPCNDDRQALLYDNSMFDNVIKTGIFCSTNFHKNQDFCKIFYDQAKIDYDKRWNSFYYDRDIDKEEELYKKLYKDKEYVFLHDDEQRQLKININFDNFIKPLHTFGEINQYTLFNYTKILENAKEIHCIDSSFACFIDHIESLKNKPKFIHRYVRKDNSNPYYKNNWVILDE